MKKVDMSEKAILKRLDQTEQLREVSLFLIKAKRLQDENLRKNADLRKSLKTKPEEIQTKKL